MRRDHIIDVRAFIVGGGGGGGDYHDRTKGHWLIDTLIANPVRLTMRP
jgi:L-rhamnonate dehydratase